MVMKYNLLAEDLAEAKSKNIIKSYKVMTSQRQKILKLENHRLE